MKALRLSLITTFLLCSWVTIAQEDQNPVQTLQRDTIQVVDTLVTTVNTGDMLSTELSMSTKDSVVFNLEDDPQRH